MTLDLNEPVRMLQGMIFHILRLAVGYPTSETHNMRSVRLTLQMLVLRGVDVPKA